MTRRTTALYQRARARLSDREKGLEALQTAIIAAALGTAALVLVAAISGKITEIWNSFG